MDEVQPLVIQARRQNFRLLKIVLHIDYFCEIAPELYAKLRQTVSALQGEEPLIICDDLVLLNSRYFVPHKAGLTNSMLKYEEYGTSHTSRLLIAHGLFGSGRNWRAIAKRLSANLHVITVDMRNHAGSFWSDEMNYPAMAADLAEVIEQIGSPMMVLGHSMGGKAAMMLALRRPDLVERLLIADIAPVAYGHTQIPVIEAMQSVDLSCIQTRADGGEALAQHIDDPALRAFLAQSIKISDTEAKWRLNLEVLKNSMPEIIGWPDVSAKFEGPVLFVSGADSDYVDAAGRKVIKPLFPSARFAKLKDAGHWLHADQPKAFIETVRALCQVANAEN